MSANPVHPALREVIERLAALPRAPGSVGEAEAAEWIATRLQAAGCDAQVEPAEYHDGYAKPIGALAALATLGGLMALGRRGRLAGGVLAALAGAGIADDVANTHRVVRRRLTRPRPTQNVVAITGDRAADRTLVVLAHHDAATTGVIFDPRFQAWLAHEFPGLVERLDTSFPLWWLVLAGPGAIGLGAATRSRPLIALGTAIGAVTTATMANIHASPVVPGANDNLSAVSVLVALAERLRDEPIHGLRVMLVSCGAEEVIQGGINSFARAHFPTLPRDRTWFLTLDTVGSPILAMCEGEGPVIMEDYYDRRFRDLIARVADRTGAPLRRGMRARNSTDAVIPSHARYPTALLVSIDRHKALSNYHLPSDTPENIDYRTVAQALHVTEAVARELASNPWL
ncbi:MAG TPA: M28 family peptidase [Solirubrobacteraceae bacterium]|nr:M28 family peptidase [Solirubrobacteraceae bacterium]